jgi:hypothetical protein
MCRPYHDEAMTLQDIPLGQPITLAEAARLFQPEGSITVASLRAEHARGRLNIFKIRRAHFTTSPRLRTYSR